MFSSDPQIDIPLRIVLLAPLGVIWVIMNVRIIGLRSFSKMTAFDFVITVAIGSLLAGAVTVEKWPAYLQSIAGITMLLVTQFLIAKFRISFPKAFAKTTNDPVWLMKDGEFIEDNLATTRVTRADVYGKLREANALQMSQVHAVILESTGDISVLHGCIPDHEILPDRH